MEQKEGCGVLGLAILLAFQFIGIVLHEWLAVPLPANVIGLLLFTLSLFVGWVKLEWVEGAAQFLLKHMLLFFLPFVVGSYTLLRGLGAVELAKVLAAVAVGTFAVLALTGYMVKLTQRKENDADAGQS